MPKKMFQKKSAPIHESNVGETRGGSSFFKPISTNQKKISKLMIFEKKRE